MYGRSLQKVSAASGKSIHQPFFRLMINIIIDGRLNI
jgi:hypothetical protein